MRKSRREWYEVRVREGEQKKSKFYLERDPQSAASHYKGGGHIISIERASRERFLGVGQFFKLGDELLREFARSESIAKVEEGRDKDRVRERRAFNKSRREVIN